MLNYVTRKSAQKNCTPYEQVQVHPHISAIKELNQEDPCNVYLCEDSTGVIRGRQIDVVNPLFLLLWELHVIMDFVILEQV